MLNELELLDRVNPEQCKENIRNVVEYCLRNTFGSNNTFKRLELVKGKLSTVPELVDPEISIGHLINQCHYFSNELRRTLKNEGWETFVAGSDRWNIDDLIEHEYIICGSGDYEVLIDPTIGQYLEGYNHVFVGTRDELYSLLLNQTGEGMDYQLSDNYSNDTIDEYFDKRWGFASRRVYLN